MGKEFRFFHEMLWKNSKKLLANPILIRAFLVSQVVKKLQCWQDHSLGRKELLEEEMATHSNILAQRILQTEEPGGLQSLGSQRNFQFLSFNTSQMQSRLRSIALDISLFLWPHFLLFLSFVKGNPFFFLEFYLFIYFWLWWVSVSDWSFL